MTLIPGQSPYHANVDQSVQLDCFAKGLPLPTVQWLRNGIAVSDAQQVQVSVTAQSSHCVGVNNCDNREYKQNKSITVIFGGMFHFL